LIYIKAMDRDPDVDFASMWMAGKHIKSLLGVAAALAIVLCADVVAAVAAGRCGPHATVAFTRPRAGGATHYFCKCDPGYVPLSNITTYGNVPWPGCVPAKKKEPDRAYDCDVCHQKLMADVRKGWASVQLRPYVANALSDYGNCKRRARGSCLQGDILARSIRLGCGGFAEDAAYRACIGRVLP
jgi:hypothetical protein